MDELIISVSGLRGIVGQALNPEVAVRYAVACAEQLGEGPIVIARDSRPSGQMIGAAIEAALTGMGREVLHAGIAATPTVGVLVRQYQAAGALQISASHNPPPYNGIKVFDGSGRVLPADAGARVADGYRAQKPAKWCDFSRLGLARRIEDTIGGHLQLVLGTVDRERIRRRKFHVLLDVNHGAGGVLGRPLLEELGCRITVLGAPADGDFEHPPEPTAENLAATARKVAERNADIGFCQDPDADRLALIDERGEYVGEEYTLALCVQHRLASAQGPIVTNCASSRMSQDLAERAGVPFHQSAVGEANVVDTMLACHALYGGEGNGGPIDPRVGLVRDSFVGMAQILDLMAARGRSVRQLADALPAYAMYKDKIALPPARLRDALTALQSHFADAEASGRDGLRLEWPDRWLLVRGSNTEPIVRAIAEAPALDAARGLVEQARDVVSRMA